MFKAVTGRPLVVETVDPTAPTLAGLWRRLQNRGGVGTPFLAWEWFSALAEEPTLSRHCVVLVASRRGGSPIGLFPVEIDSRCGRLRVLRCAGTEWLGADHLDVVAAPSDRDAVASAIARHMVRRLRWDLADLEGLAGDGALTAALIRELRWPRCAIRRVASEPVPVISLQGPDSEEVLRRLRRRSARGTKSAQRAGGGYSVVEDPAAVGPVLESLMEMHNDRFGDESVVFSTPELRSFHVRAATRLAAAGMARVCRLSTDTTDIALEYVLLMDDRAFSYQSGFRPDGGHSPGRTVMCRSMLTAAEEGRNEYDLLRGDEEYKSGYATGDRSDAHVRALGFTPRSAIWLARRGLHRLTTLSRVASGGPHG